MLRRQAQTWRILIQRKLIRVFLKLYFSDRLYFSAVFQLYFSDTIRGKKANKVEEST